MPRWNEILIAGRPLRRWGKWGGLAVSAISAVVLGVSIWFRAGYISPSGWAAGLGPGGVVLGRITPGPLIASGGFAERNTDGSFEFLWLPLVSVKAGRSRTCGAALDPARAVRRRGGLAVPDRRSPFRVLSPLRLRPCRSRGTSLPGVRPRDRTSAGVEAPSPG